MRADCVGTVERVVTVVRNVTDRKQAERTLRESEERFRAIAEATAVGMPMAVSRMSDG